MARGVKKGRPGSAAVLVGLQLYALFMPASMPCMAQSDEIANRVLRNLEGGKRAGQQGVVLVSQAVLDWDREHWNSEITVAFERAESEIGAARRILRKYDNGLPKTKAEWGEKIGAHRRIQQARESFQEVVRDKIADRRPRVEQVFTDMVIESGREDVFKDSKRAQSKSKVFKDVYDRALRDLESGNPPQVTWPPNFNDAWVIQAKQAIEQAFFAIQRGDDSALPLFRSQMDQIQQDLVYQREELKEFARVYLAALSQREKALFLELNVMTQMQFDIVTNAVMQETTIKKTRRWQYYIEELWDPFAP